MRSDKKRPQSSPESEPMAEVGKIVGVFGLEGFVKVSPFTDFPERFDEGESLFLDGVRREIIDSHWKGMQVRIKFRGVTHINHAEPLVGKSLYIPISERPELDEDEYYLTDLIGMTVKTKEGRVLGPVKDIFQGPAQDVLVIGDIYIPMVFEFIHKVDLKKKVITVTPAPGMIPEEETS